MLWCLSSFEFKQPRREVEKYSRRITQPTESRLAWLCLHVLLLPPKLTPGDDLDKMSPLAFRVVFQQNQCIVSLTGYSNASVSQEARPELGAKGVNGAVEIRMKINPSCYGTIVLGVHFFCWVPPLFS